MPLRYDRLPGIIYELRGGLSPEFRFIQNSLNLARQHIRQPITRSSQDLLKTSVLDISYRYSEEGWDGYDANAISPESTAAALRLIDQLPEDLQDPEVVPDPGGEIALEWNSGKDMLFSLTVGGSILVYAGIMGANRRYGQERFFDEIPQTIVDTLSSYFRKI